MLNLLTKDFKLIFAKQGDSKKKALAIIGDIILVALFVAIETFIFTTLLKRIKSFNNAPRAFLTIFLAFISLCMIMLNTNRAKKLFFNNLDIEQLTQHPVSSESILMSKLILLFFMHYVTSLVFIYPLFISYGLLISKSMWFYYIVVFYPLFSFFFEGGLSLLLVYPYKLFRDYLNKHIVMEFITSIIIMVLVGATYAVILNLFMQLVGDNNLNLLFTVSNINKILDVARHLVPVNFLVDLFINANKSSFLPLFTISLGVFLIGCSVATIAYSYFRSVVFYDKKKKERKTKVLTPTKQLFKKEFLLLFKDENYIFSFTGLLVIQPLLMYLVVGAINTIFNSGTYLYYMKILPAFLPFLDILIILLFTCLISSGANQYIRMEEKTMKIIKSIPVSYKKQIGIKVLIPFIFSLSSLLISLIVLVSFRTIRFDTFIFSFILSIILLMAFDEVSLIQELSPHQKSGLTKLISYVLPLLAFVGSVLLSFLKVNVYIIYAIDVAIFLIISILLYLYLNKHLSSKFMDLEVVN